MSLYHEMWFVAHLDSRILINFISLNVTSLVAMASISTHVAALIRVFGHLEGIVGGSLARSDPVLLEEERLHTRLLQLLHS